MTELQIEASKLALKNMMQKGHFDICVVHEILKLTGGVPDAGDYSALRLLHCTNFIDLPPNLRIEFPKLLQRVLSSPSMSLEISFKPKFEMPELLLEN
jgi:hypothetical protein